MLSVSIVIPTWNESRRIVACLRNATTQTVPAREVLVIDNNSTDNTRELVRDFIAQHPDAGVSLYEQSAEQGLIPTRNYGLELASSDIITRIDADCMIKPNWVEVISRFFMAHPDVAGATGPVCYYDMPLPFFGMWWDNLVREKQYSADSMPLLFGSNMAMRKAAWDAIKSSVCRDHEDIMHEDIDVSLHLFEHDYRTYYCKDMISGISARRIGTPFDSFIAYMGRFANTFNAHPGHKRGGYPEKTLLLIYPLLHSIHAIHSAWTELLRVNSAERLWAHDRALRKLD